MRFLIVDHYYNAFLRQLYADVATLADQPYATQWRTVMDRCFGTADFYSRNLEGLGHEAHEVVVNNRPLQLQWLREFGEPNLRTSELAPHALLEAQVRHFRPDVLHLQEMSVFDDAFLSGLRKHTRLIVGQIACPLPPERDYSGFDLIVSSLPNFVEYFRGRGKNAAYLRLGFEPSILDRVDTSARNGPALMHIGGITNYHEERRRLFERLCSRFDLKLWGYGIDELPEASAIRKQWQGEAWGLDMYRLMATTRIVPNIHLAEAEHYANNMRLYEATGMGALLITDNKSNLRNLFEPGTEVIAYDSHDDCEAKIAYYLDHPAEAAAIARAGQQRTLGEHTWSQRMAELAEIVSQYL